MVVNIYPGAEIFQLEGHSAIAVQIPGKPVKAYNYGVFDFNSPNFIGRFVMGRTDYVTVAWPYDPFMAEYYSEGRRAVAHELDLDPDAKQRLVSLLEWQALPENRTYRYNYVKDNCATRIVERIDQAVGARVVYSDSINYGSFRREMREYHRNYPWYQFGIDLALGSGIDRPPTDGKRCLSPSR